MVGSVIGGSGRSGVARRGIDVRTVVAPPPRRAVPWFERWVADSIPSSGSVRNIGGGCDASGELATVRRRAGHLVVVDPSDHVWEHASADERHHCTLEQLATDHSHRHEYDVAFAVFVLEHVRRPQPFAAAAAAVLRPGGTFLAITVNQWHYFGLAGWASTRLGVADRLLEAVRDHGTVAEYHVPTEYRLNTIGGISRHLAAAGFTSVEFRMWDLPRMYQPYLPRPVRGLADVWHAGVYRAGIPNLMGHLTLRATVPDLDSPRGGVV